MTSKRVFILGAGFSKQAGMLLATELTEPLFDRFKKLNLDKVFSWYKWLKQRMDWLGYSINIEQVFDLAYFDAEALRMVQHRCPLGRNAGDVPWSKAEHIENWLLWMEHDLANVVWDKQKEAKQKLETISKFSKNLQEDDVVLTFNYDTLLENSLSEQKIDWWYGFEQEEKKIGMIILKMHGSINWKIANRGESSSNELLFRKEDIHITECGEPVPNEPEYKYDLARVHNEKVDGFIREKEYLKWKEPYYDVGIAGLGAHKPLHLLPGSGEVWFTAMKTLWEAHEIYVVGFSLSPFDSMSRLHFAGVMLKRSEENKLPKKIALIDPNACELKGRFSSVFGQEPPIEIINKHAEKVDWSVVLR